MGTAVLLVFHLETFTKVNIKACAAAVVEDFDFELGGLLGWIPFLNGSDPSSLMAQLLKYRAHGRSLKDPVPITMFCESRQCSPVHNVSI